MRLLLLAVLLLPTQAFPAQSEVIELGRANWERPWLPDLQHPPQKVTIPTEKRIDVAILGDGYLADERAKFEADVRSWYERFLEYYPWNRLRGAFRVRGLWTPSEGRATVARKSYYRLPATTSEVGDTDGKETRQALFAALDRLGVNRAERSRYLTHTVVVMLVLNERRRNPSGKSRSVVSPDGKIRVKVAFAAYTHHEFGHAYGRLRDEYIQTAESRTKRTQPERISLSSVSNVAYTTDLSLLPWAHLTPGTALNPDKTSVIGVCWIGGISELGAWHSEGLCLMNGRHENWDLGKTRRRAGLRDKNRYCFWCEEILVARTYAKAGLLQDSDDGEALWRRWVAMRPLYHKTFDVANRIRAQNAANLKAGLHEAKIYVRPQQRASSTTP